MGITELLLIAIGLSMDAFAVAVTNGMCKKNIKLGWTFITAIVFGLFQGVMPVIGYFLGQTFTGYIQKFDHIIALVLLGFIGGKMLYDAIKSKNCETCDSNSADLKFGELMLQGVATSIDALAVGVSFSAMNTNIVISAGFIAAVTFILSFAAVFIGKKFGAFLNRKAEIVGGLILIAIGLKIFIEHTFFGG
ncbi:MAG: manganese efflux pump MntP family protein [Oscillospiraceae bacterium]